MNDFVDKLKRYLFEKKVSQTELSTNLGYSDTYISRILNGKDKINTKFIATFLDKYKDFDSNEEFALPKYTEKIEPVKLNFRLAPVINRYAYASYTDSWDDPEFIETLQTLPTTEMEDGNYLWFEVKGDSMSSETYPSIEEGDFILGRELYKHHWEHLQLRRVKVWIIVHREKGILIKEIVKQKGSVITCFSWNALIGQFDLDLNDINQMFYFKQLLRTKM